MIDDETFVSTTLGWQQGGLSGHYGRDSLHAPAGRESHNATHGVVDRRLGASSSCVFSLIAFEMGDGS
jgi:hypothetical protein